jgi:hypothetical protein
MVNVRRGAQLAVTAADLLALVVPPADDAVGDERGERQRTGPDPQGSKCLAREAKPFMVEPVVDLINQQVQRPVRCRGTGYQARDELDESPVIVGGRAQVGHEGLLNH